MKFFISVIVILVSVIGITKSQQRYMRSGSINTDNKSYYVEQEKEIKVNLDIRSRLPSLGFQNIIADWNFLQFIQYFGDTKAREIMGYELVTDYFKNVVTNDPRFIKAFFLLSTANSLYAVRPEITVQLTDQVLSNIYPQLDKMTPFVWSYKGVDQLLFLGQGKEARKSYLMAAKWALERNDPDSQDIANMNLQMAAFLADDPDSRTAQIGAWTQILREAQEEETQKRVIDEIRKLGGDIRLDEDGQIIITAPDVDS
jgi:hypothetical protein